MSLIKWLNRLLKIKKIRTQLIFSIAFVHLLLMSIFVLDMVKRQRRFLLEQSHNQALSVANELAVNASTYILANDLDGLERLAKSYSNFPYLRYCMVISPEGTLLAHTQVRYVGQVPVDSISRTLKMQATPQTLFEDSAMLDIAVPINYNGNIIGVARIGFSKEHINENLDTIVRNGMWYIAVALIIGTVIAIIMGRRLSSGLYKLIATADKIRLGDRGMRVGLLNSYELQKLGTAFNQMIEEIGTNENMLKKTNRDIGERIKELNCLYRISELSHSQDKEIEEILNDCVAIVPPAYQYPEITCARITFEGQQYLSAGVFRESPWRQAANIKVAAAVVGQLEVFYTEQMPEEDEGPFLKEERLLITSFTAILGEALERKKTELAVREAELKFRNLVEKSLVGVYIMQHGKFVYVNPQILIDSGFSEAEFFTKTIYDLVITDDWPVIDSHIAKRQSGEAESVQYEVRARTKDGATIWLEVFGSVTMYKGARAMIGTMINITERKAVYDEMKTSEAKLKSIFDSTDVFYLLLDRNYKIIALNQHMKEAYLAGAGIELYEGGDLMKLMPPEKRENARISYDKVMESNEAFNYETIYVHNGGRMHLWANVKPINDGKKVIGVCVSSIDITERQQALEQLKKLNENLQKNAEELAISNADLEHSKKRYSELFNFSPLPAWVTDASTLRFLDVNNAAVLHYGYSREEFLSMTLKEIRPVEEIPNMQRAVNERSKQKNGISRVVMVHRKKDGELMNVEIQIVPILYSGVKAIIGIATDITERLNYTNAIEAQNKRLLEISWIQSHIVRAPLSRIMGLIPMLGDPSDTAAEQKTILNYISTSAHELDEIIKAITDKSKIEDFQTLKSDMEGNDN